MLSDIIFNKLIIIIVSVLENIQFYFFILNDDMKFYTVISLLNKKDMKITGCRQYLRVVFST